MKLLLRFASGPITFLLLYLLPMGELSPQARTALAVFGWMIAWWMTQPMPWAISSLLPLILFPMLQLMSIGNTVGLYGQEIFFWIWGTVMMGYALDRHGLAKRFALWFLSLPFIGGSTQRLAFGFMVATGLISMIISDAATVAMMIPVGVSLVSYVRTVSNIPKEAKSNFGAFIALGTLYGAVAGGTTTLAGLPHNAVSNSLLQSLTGEGLTWFGWMKAGVPIFLVTVVIFYFLLLFFFPPEMKIIPGGEEYLQSERNKLGAWSAGEKATFAVFVTMALLFTLPTFIGFAFGPGHSVTRWSAMALSSYVVPPTILMLLFCVPVNWRKGEFVLESKDALAHTPWNILLLCTAAPAVVDALVEFGFVEVAGSWIGGLGLGQISLPIAAALIVAFMTNFISGIAATSLAGSILIPAAVEIGWNPASMAMLIPNVALGIAFPWAGAAAGTAFATGEIDIKHMVRVGMVATVLFAVAVAIIHMLMAPIL